MKADIGRKKLSRTQQKQPPGKIIIDTDLDIYRLPINTLKNTKLSDFKGKLFNELYNEAMSTTDIDNSFQKELLEPISVKKPKTNLRPSKSPNEVKTKTKNIKQKNKSISISSQNDFNEINNNKNKKQNDSISLSTNAIIKGNHLTIREFKIDKIVFQMKYNTRMGEDLAVIGSINELGSWDQNKPLKMYWNEDNIWKAEFYFNFKFISDFEYKFIFLSNGRVKQWEDGDNRKFILSQVKGLIEPNLINGDIIRLKNIMNQNLKYDCNTYILTIICEWNKK